MVHLSFTSPKSTGPCHLSLSRKREEEEEEEEEVGWRGRGDKDLLMLVA